MTKKKVKVNINFDSANNFTAYRNAVGKEINVNELKKYGFPANLGNDVAWLAAKVVALKEARLKEHEMTPKGYRQMLKDFG